MFVFVCLRACVCVCVCVCVRETDRQTDRQTEGERESVCVCVGGGGCSAGGACMSFSGLNALAKCQDAMPIKHTNTPTTTTLRPRKGNIATLTVSDHTIGVFPGCILLIEQLHCEFA